MADIRLKTITVDSSPLTIKNGDVLILNSTPSTSTNVGSLVSYGGISIVSTENATSSTSGGAMTIAGGIGVAKNVYIGKNLVLDSLTGEFRIKGLTTDRLLLNSDLFSISLDGVNKLLELTNDSVKINITRGSSGTTSASVVIAGVVSIGSTENSVNVSQGGGLTIAGGASIAKTVYVGQGIQSTGDNTIGNLFTTTSGNVGIGTTNPLTRLAITPNTYEKKITLYQPNLNVNQHTGFGVSPGQLDYSVHSTEGSHVFYAGEKELMRIRGDGNVGIGTTNPLYNLDVDGTIGFGITINSYGNIINNASTYGNTFTITTQTLINKLKVDYAIGERCISTWYNRKSSMTTTFNAIGYSISASRFVAVGNIGSVFYSNDGINWIENQIVDTSITFYDIAWSRMLNMFVAVGYNGSNVVKTAVSTDGITWTVNTVSAGLLRRIIWSDDLSLFIAISNNGVLRSTNGTTWTTINSIVSTTINDVCWSSELNKLIVVTDSTVYESVDGITWISISIPYSLKNVCWSDTFSMFLGVESNKIYWSKDGREWQLVYTGNVDHSYNNITWSPELNMFTIIVRNTVNSTYYIYASPNGLMWTQYYTSSFVLNKHFWSRDYSMFVGVGVNNIMTSDIALPSVRSTVLTNPGYMFINNSNGNVGIGTTAPTSKLEVNGTIAVGGVTCSNMLISGSITAGSVNASNVTMNNIYVTNVSSGTIQTGVMTTSNLVCVNTMSSGNLSVGMITVGNIKVNGGITAGSVITNTVVSTGLYHTLGNVMINNTSVGVNTSTPSCALDIKGSMNVSSNITVGGNFILQSSGSMIINATQNNAMMVEGGVNIGKGMTVGSLVRFMDTTPSYGTGTASVYIRGGVDIQCTENATSKTAGGALTIAGGASIFGDLYIGGQIFNTDIGQSSFDKLNVVGTQPSSNYSTGTILTQGGITILSTVNSVNLSNGGALLVAGGASIGKDVYIGGDNYVYGQSRYVRNVGVSGKTSHIMFRNNSTSLFSFDTESSTVGSGIFDFKVGRYSAGNYVDTPFYIAGDSGQIVFNNTMASTGILTAAVLVMGGMNINSTVNATSITAGGALTVGGGVSIEKDVIIGGDVRMLSETESATVNYGALVIKGGMGIGKNLNVGGNLAVLGDLYVRGASTFVETSNTMIEDNILLFNSAPAGSRDSGIIIQRFQQSNDSSFGDVVSDEPKLTFTLPSQSLGLLNNQFQIANSIGNSYVNWWIRNTTTGQVRKITGHNDTTGVITVDSAITKGNSQTVQFFNKPYVGLFFNEVQNRFEFAATLENPTSGNYMSVSEYIPVKCETMEIVNTGNSTSASTGALVIGGGIAIHNTTNAASVTSGGAFTALGGASFGKDVYIGGSLFIQNNNITPHQEDIYQSGTIGVLNNVTSQSVTGLSFTNNVWGFDVYLSAKLLLDDAGDLIPFSSFYHIRGVNKETGWEIVQTYVGDDLEIQFGINVQTNNKIQLTYSTPDYTQAEYGGLLFNSLKFKWRAFVV